MSSSSLSVVGNQPISLNYLPDTVQRHQPGLLLTASDTYWGGRELIYARAAGSIRAGGLCVITPTLASGAYRFDATEVPNTANLGRPVFVAAAPMSSGQFGWFFNSGVCPVNSTSSIAAGTTFGIVAAGQGGVNSAGKQVLNAVVVAPATTTVAKTGVANSGSNQLRINGDDGWFIGAYLSGTGIAAGTTVLSISDDGMTVTLSANTTAAVNGTVTATYNNGTVFYNIVHVDRPFAQGAIT